MGFFPIHTINDDGCRGAPAFSNNILSNAGIVGSIGKPGLLNYEVVVNCYEEIGVLRRVYNVFIS